MSFSAKCPFCGAKLNRTSDDGSPEPGDLSVCIYCASALIFTEQFTLRAATAAEIAALPDEVSTELRQTQRAVRAMDRRTAQERLAAGETLSAPHYWQHEATGVLRRAVEAYLLNKDPLAAEHVAAIRAYLRQWIAAPVWGGVEDLRQAIDGLTSRETIDRWLDDALERGIDPL